MTKMLILVIDGYASGNLVAKYIFVNLAPKNKQKNV